MFNFVSDGEKYLLTEKNQANVKKFSKTLFVSRSSSLDSFNSRELIYNLALCI